MNEDWRPVVGFESTYSVSSEARVRNNRTGKILKPSPLKLGYLAVRLWSAEKNHGFTTRVATIVAAAFHGPRPEGAWINHIDANKQNNRPSNLEYDTPRHNHDHAVAHRLHPWGARHHAAKLTESQVREIRASAEPERVLMARFGVSKSAVQSIKARRSWRYLTDEAVLT